MPGNIENGAFVAPQRLAAISTLVDQREKERFQAACKNAGTSPGDAIRSFIAAAIEHDDRTLDQARSCKRGDQQDG